MAVLEKNGTWYAVISYTDDFNKRKKKWVRAANITEAKKLDKMLQVGKMTGKYKPDAERMRVKDLCEKFLELVVKPNRRQSTYNQYLYALNKFKATFGSVWSDKLTTMRIQEWVNKLNLERSGTTASEYFNAVSVMLNQAVKWKIIQFNPCVDVVKPAKNKPNSGAYSKNQVEILLNIAQESDIYYFVLMGALCGLRSGEMCALQTVRFSLKERRAYISKTISRIDINYARQLPKDSDIEPLWETIKSDKAKTVLALSPTKTAASENFVPLPDVVIAELEVLEKERKWDKQKFGEAYKDYGFICCWPDGTPYEPNYVNKQFHKLVENYNLTAEEPLPILRVHDLRHTHATLLLKEKVDIKIVARGLRQSNPSFTRAKYQHVLDDMVSEPANVMDRLFGQESVK